MSIPPLPPSAAPEKVAQAYSRLQELFGGGELPEVVLCMGQVEPFLRDFAMNYRKFVCTEGALDVRTKALLALAAACQSRCPAWWEVLCDRARGLGVTEHQLREVVALVATNAMYNGFFKFRELSGSELFGGMPVGLRAHTLAGTSLDEKTVELISLVVSNLNGCRPCTSGHVEAARRLGLTDEQILEAVQCAATMAGVCQFTTSALPACGTPSTVE